jgi:hypothetical protein
MEGWLLGLVVKPFIGIAFLLGLVVAARLVAWLLYWLIPDCKLKRELYRTSVTDPTLRRPRLLPARKADR